MHETHEPKEYWDEAQAIANADVLGLKKANESYGDSWKRRGGVGAFMMLARKWDRLENRVEQRIENKVGDIQFGADGYDIFAHAVIDRRSEGIIDDIRDLRRYLLLVEIELKMRGAIHGVHRDNS
jgi:hypothetical protein